MSDMCNRQFGATARRALRMGYAAILGGMMLMPRFGSAEEPELKFDSRPIETAAVNWWARALGDVNADGLLDIFVQNNNGGGGWLGWYETGADCKTWTRHIIAEQSPEGGTFASGDLDAGDIDNDGHIDTLGIENIGERRKPPSESKVYWYRNPKAAGDPATNAWDAHYIGTAPHFIKDASLADFNGDGMLDLAVLTDLKDRFVVFRQDSPTSWTQVQNFAVPNLHEGMDVGDITGNGLPDVATNGYWIETPGGDLTGKWIVRSIDEKWHNQEDPGWPKNATKVFCRDITGDKRVEVFISHSEQDDYPVSWYEAEDPRQGPWKEHVIAEGLAAVHTLQVFDFDEDGDMDVLAGSNKGRAEKLERTEFPVAIFLNDGKNQNWTRFVIDNKGIYNGQVGDLDGNGRPDIFRLTDHEAELFEVLLNTQ